MTSSLAPRGGAVRTSPELEPTPPPCTRTPFIERHWRAMGCDVRLVAASTKRGPADLEAAADHAAAFVGAAAACLTRFDPRSELRQLDARPEATVTASPLLTLAVAAAVRAARQSGGLLDPALAAPLAAAGYASTWDPSRRLPLGDLLALAPLRRPARPAPSAAWRDLHADRAAGVIHRPPGTRLDLGATAKGLIAGLALQALGPLDHGFVDAGGDLAIHAPHGLSLYAADPFGGEPTALRAAASCGVATSSIAGRCWLTPDGAPAHHLLDPSTGRAAFTGVVQVTAAAPSAAGAERLAGQALLSGPGAACSLVARHGGLVVLDDATTIHLPGDLLR